jgi:hypothetical protein
LLRYVFFDAKDKYGANWQVLEEVICPRIYRLLSDMLPAVSEAVTMSVDKVTFIARLTKCFSDCAAILVIDHRRLVSPASRIQSGADRSGLVDVHYSIWTDVLVQARG